MSNSAYIIQEQRLKAKSLNSTPADIELRGFPAPEALVVGDWRMALVMQGYGGIVNIGDFSTPITGGGAGTILDLDQPEGVLSVPRGTTLIPIRFTIQCQAPLLATDSDEIEALITVDRATAWLRDGTRTDETVFNMRTDKGDLPILAASAFTADTTDPVHSFDLARAVKVGDVQGTPTTTMWTELFVLYEPAIPPLIVGPAAVWFYWGGTVATTGFAQAMFLAVPSARFDQMA